MVFWGLVGWFGFFCAEADRSVFVTKSIQVCFSRVEVFRNITSVVITGLHAVILTDL